MKPAALGILAGLATGAAVGAASRGPSLVPWPGKVRPAFPIATGVIAGTATGIKVGTTASVMRALRGRGDGPGPVPLVLGGALLAAGVVAAPAIKARMLSHLSTQGRDLDPGFATPPANPLVSGSVESLVAITELGREGARFVGSAMSPEDIAFVVGKKAKAKPVRVFIGVVAADTVEQRVGLAMAELRRTGAFDRGHLVIQAPAGTGYANSTPIDVTELLTRGDCASVAIGYGLLPSFLSLGKVELGARTQRLLLEAIHAELSTREQRPLIHLYGESLGAKVQQAALNAGPLDLNHFGIASALWVGTPGGAQSDRFHALCAAESITVDRPGQIIERLRSPRPRVWFCEHDGDPVVRFRPELLINRPSWLEPGDRGRHVPERMSWKPVLTWLTVLVDTLFATDVKPGDFQSLGHDYRADLGAVVTAAYDLPMNEEMAQRLELHLRELERTRAGRIDAPVVAAS